MINDINSPAASLDMDKYRVNLENFGSLFGKQLYVVGVKNADLKYNEKLRAGLPVPNRPIRLFTIDKHNITSVEADIDASNCPVVIFNKGKKSEARFAVTKPEFKEVEVATVREAVEAAENKRAPIFFKDCQRLTAEITQLNIQERNRANDFAKEMAMQASLIDDTIKIQQEEQVRYYASLNQATEVEITASINVG